MDKSIIPIKIYWAVLIVGILSYIVCMIIKEYQYENDAIDAIDNFYTSTYEVIPMSGKPDTAYVVGPYSYKQKVYSYDPIDYSKGKVYVFCGIKGIRIARFLWKNKSKPEYGKLFETNITFKNGAPIAAEIDRLQRLKP